MVREYMMVTISGLELLLMRKLRNILMTVTTTTVGLHEPLGVGVSAGELLHKRPELRGTGLNLHGARYVHHLHSL